MSRRENDKMLSKLYLRFTICNALKATPSYLCIYEHEEEEDEASWIKRILQIHVNVYARRISGLHICQTIRKLK